jgi:hypothetical protein
VIKRLVEQLKDPQNRTKIILKMSVSASLASLGIVLSTIVVFVPNMEFISVTIFLVSLLFGTYYGLMVAISVPVVYEFIIIAIVGSAGFLIYFKLISYIALALITGSLRKTLIKISFWELGILGSFFAIIYDILTTIGYQIVVIKSEFVFSYLLVLLGSGIVFTVSHIISNFILFSFTKTMINWIYSAFKARGIKQLMIPSFYEEEIKSSLEGGIT